jgi:hypothetical protein
VNATGSAALTLACSFCRKSSDEIEKLVAGPGVYICNECIDLAAGIVAEELRRSVSRPQRPESLEDRPIEELLELFSGMAVSSRAVVTSMQLWARRLMERGVPRARIAQAAGMTEADLVIHLAV